MDRKILRKSCISHTYIPHGVKLLHLQANSGVTMKICHGAVSGLKD